MSEPKSSKCPPDVVVNLSPEQQVEMKSTIEKWQSSKGLIIGSLHDKDGKYLIGFRQFPTEIGNQIIKIVNDYYEGGNNVNS